MFRKLTAAAIAGAALFAPAASADPIIEGCYGAEGVVVCDPDVTYGVPVGVETYQDEVTVCAGSCTDYRVTLVRTTSGDPLTACVTTQDRSGTPTTRCATVPAVPPTQPYVDAVVTIVENEREWTADAYESVVDYLCDPYDDVPFNCNSGVGNTLRNLERTIRGS